MEQCIRSSSNSVVLGKTRGAGLLFFLFIIDIDWLNRRNPTYQVPSGNRTSTIWLFNIAMENSTIFKFGKPSISIRAVEKPWRTVSHNQRVCHQILQIPGWMDLTKRHSPVQRSATARKCPGSAAGSDFHPGSPVSSLNGVRNSWEPNIAIENGHRKWIFPWKIVIFHSYVSLPEGSGYKEPPKKNLGMTWNDHPLKKSGGLTLNSLILICHWLHQFHPFHLPHLIHQWLRFQYHSSQLHWPTQIREPNVACKKIIGQCKIEQINPHHEKCFIDQSNQQIPQFLAA